MGFKKIILSQLDHIIAQDIKSEEVVWAKNTADQPDTLAEDAKTVETETVTEDTIETDKMTTEKEVVACPEQETLTGKQPSEGHKAAAETTCEAGFLLDDAEQ